MVDVAIEHTAALICSSPLANFASNNISSADSVILLPTASNADMNFFETDLMMVSTVDFILFVISFVISSAAVFDSAFTSSLIATEQITAAPIINVTITIEAAVVE